MAAKIKTSSEKRKGGKSEVQATEKSSPSWPVRAPQQKRSEATLARILAAVNKLIASGAYEEATVSDIVRLAKCSVGSFYARFTDKDAALFALYDARCNKLEEIVLSVLESGKYGKQPLTRTLSTFVECVVDHTLENAGFIRAEGFLSSPKSSAPFWGRAQEMNKNIHAALAGLLDAERSEMTHKDPETAALITLSIVGGLPREAVKSGAALFEVSIEPSEDYKAEIRRAVLGYLGVK